MALLFSGCSAPKFLRASTIQYPPFPDQAKEVEDPAKARIYLMREEKFVGAAAAVQFYGSNPDVASGPRAAARSRMRLVGEVGPGGYICWEQPPGRFMLARVQGRTNSIYSVDLQPARVYYFRASIHAGWRSAKIIVDELNEKDGKALLLKSRPPDDYQHQTTQNAKP